MKFSKLVVVSTAVFLLVTPLAQEALAAQVDQSQQQVSPWQDQAEFKADWLPDQTVSADVAAQLRGEFADGFLTSYGVRFLIKRIPWAIAKKIERYRGTGATFAQLREATSSNFIALMYYLAPYLLYPGIAYSY